MDQINPKLKSIVVGRHGMYAKVIKEGSLYKDDTIKITQEAVNV